MSFVFHSKSQKFAPASKELLYIAEEQNHPKATIKQYQAPPDCRKITGKPIQVSGLRYALLFLFQYSMKLNMHLLN